MCATLQLNWGNTNNNTAERVIFIYRSIHPTCLHWQSAKTTLSTDRTPQSTNYSMMASRLYLKASALCANRATNFVQTASRVVGSTSIGSNNYFYNGGVSTANNGSNTSMMMGNPFQQQQQRFKMTKAKIKHTIRHRRRKVWAEKGKELPKPPGYMPRDLPVANVISRDIMQEEIRKADEQDKKEIEERRVALMEETPLRHHMTGLTMSERVRKLLTWTMAIKRKLFNTKNTAEWGCSGCEKEIQAPQLYKVSYSL